MNKTNKIYLLIFITAICVLFFCKNNSKELNRSISTNGKCVKKIKADKFKLSVSFKGEDRKSSKKATKQAEDSYKKTTALLNKLKKTDKSLKISTDRISLTEEGDWDKDKKKYVNLRKVATLGLRIESSDKTSINKVFDEVTKYNNSKISYFNSYISDELKNKAKIECLSEALKNAKEKANKILSGANSKVGKVINVNERGNHFPIMMREERASFKAGNSVKKKVVRDTIEIFEDEEKIEYEVDAVFEIK